MNTMIYCQKFNLHLLDLKWCGASTNFVQSADSDYLCNVKTSKRDVVIPSGKQVNIQCRVNRGPICGTTSVLFEPDETMSGPSWLEFDDTLLTVKKGKTHFIEVQANNPTNHDIVLSDGQC
jgi:hypothetical protein